MGWKWWLAIGAGALLFPRKATAMIGTAVSSTDFAARLWRALETVAPDLPRVSRLIVIAQGALETGWGKAGVAPKVYNYWNLTAGSGFKGPGSTWDGATLQGSDTDGYGRAIVQVWRAYRDEEDATRDFLSSFIGPSTKYRAAYQALLQGDLPLYVKEIRRQGYFTAPEAEYRSTLEAVANTVERLASAAGV
jgi:flagellum-specific peptidoglycan hydrolase FlgJ